MIRAALRALVRRRPDSHESVTRAAAAATAVAVYRQESKSKEAYLLESVWKIAVQQALQCTVASSSTR